VKLPQLTPPTHADADALDARKLLSDTVAQQRKTIIGLVIAVICLSLGYIGLFPLKERIPYVVEVSKVDGEAAVPRQQEAIKFAPTEASVLFFVRRWIKGELQIQPQLTQENEAMVLQMLRGDAAITKHKAFRAQDKTFARVGAEPTLVRDVVINSITPVAGSAHSLVAQVTLTTTSRTGTTVEGKLVTVFYQIFSPKTVKDVENQPIGLYITDFRIADTN